MTDNRNRCVYIYSHPGQHVRCIQLSGGLNPWRALTDQSDGYVFTHGSAGQLVWVSSAGQVTRRYTDTPAVCASRITDYGTHLLVSDTSNKCVHVVTREGRHDGHMITDIDHTHVCLDSVGRRLWVASKEKDGWSGHVMKMSYTPQSSAVMSPMTSALTSSVCSLILKVNLPQLR